MEKKKREVVRLPVLLPELDASGVIPHGPWPEGAEPGCRKKVSYSEWMTFRTNCEWRWYLEYVLKIRRNDESAALGFGTAMHGTLEVLLQPDRSLRPSIDEAVGMFQARMGDELIRLDSLGALPFGPWEEGPDGKHHPHSPTGLMESGERIIRSIPTVPDLWESEVVALEFELEDSISRTDGDVRFRGFVDFMATVRDGHGNLVFIVGDFKTCKWGWPRPKKEDPDVLAQPRLYKHFLCKQFGVDPRRMRTYFFLMKKEPGPRDPIVVEPLRIPSSERDLSRTIASLQADLTRMRGDELERNRDSCKRPWGMCPHYGTAACPSSPEVDAVVA